MTRPGKRWAWIFLVGLIVGWVLLQLGLAWSDLRVTTRAVRGGSDFSTLIRTWEETAGTSPTEGDIQLLADHLALLAHRDIMVSRSETRGEIVSIASDLIEISIETDLGTGEHRGAWRIRVVRRDGSWTYDDLEWSWVGSSER